MYTSGVWKEYLATRPDVNSLIQTRITIATRDIIIDTIGKLTNYMKPMGDMIISGGEAFNSYFTPESQIVTTDIDTKFSPLFRIGPKKILMSRDPLFFEHIQITKLILWDKLGQVALALNDRIRKRIQKMLPDVTTVPLTVTRRYTLIRKHKQSDDEKVTEGDTLIDIELFALDVHVIYNGVKMDIGGLLDIAFMRPSEIGYDVIYTRQHGIKYHNPITGKQLYNKNVLVSSKKFLIEDLYILQSLNLRPKKKSKDQLRMYRFAKTVLGVNVKTSDTISTIFKKCKPHVPITNYVSKRPIFHLKYWLKKALRVDPLKYRKVTTRPHTILAPGIQGPKGLRIPGYKPTYSDYIFNLRKHVWLPTSSNMYIKNEMNYRPSNTRVPSVFKPTLYGYKPDRNIKIPRSLINKSMLIGEVKAI